MLRIPSFFPFAQPTTAPRTRGRPRCGYLHLRKGLLHQRFGGSGLRQQLHGGEGTKRPVDGDGVSGVIKHGDDFWLVVWNMAFIFHNIWNNPSH